MLRIVENMGGLRESAFSANDLMGTDDFVYYGHCECCGEFAECGDICLRDDAHAVEEESQTDRGDERRGARAVTIMKENQLCKICT